MLFAKNILIISPEAWGISMLSKHHYARTLAELGNNVWFLQPPVAQSGKFKEAALPVILLEDNYLIRGVRFLPGPIRKFMFRKVIAKIYQDTNIQFDIVWNFDNSRFFDLDCFGKAFTIHHRMDYHYDFQNRRASRSAHLCLGVTSGIVKSMKKYNRNTHFIQHGYAALTPIFTPFPTIQNSLRALYIGNLAVPYMNWKWIHALVQSHPHIDFLFVGPYQKSHLRPSVEEEVLEEIKILRQYTNVKLLGEKLPAELVSLMSQADILFAAYRSAEFPELLANSHKIMNYLGSGKPVVCQELSEYVPTQDLLYMAQTETEYLKLFDEVIERIKSGKENKEAYRIAFAESNTYQKQLERIDQLIDKTQHG